ncbi:MAG: acetolactate synthase large subunit [Nitrospirae bacterium]|nr:MAG: acetolactate synthase large subunit [Nitrospirota bacterium]
MNAAELLIRCLENEGVELVFGVPGEENLHILDALADSAIRFIPVRHEQGAAFMADVYGRLTGKAGVCLSTLGPGATNLLTGVADANMDRAPLVALTGQANLDRMHKESHQCVDIVRIFRPVTKWNAGISRSSVIPEAVRKAFKVAQTEKPGATHLDIPEDIVAETFAESSRPEPLLVQAPFRPEPLARQIERAQKVLAQARRPVFLAGHGAIRNQAADAVRACAQRLNIPVLHTFMAKGLMPDHHPLSLYTLGLKASDHANQTIGEADLVITVGYDFVEFAPCLWNPDRDKHIVHLDLSPAEVDAHYLVDVGVLGDLRLSLEQIAEGLDPWDSGWATHVRNRVESMFQRLREAPRTWPMRPQHIIEDLRAELREDALVITDVGFHKLWMARLFSCYQPNTCILSNGYAAMGLSLPGAVAAKLLYPDRPVVAVVGDGGFLMNAHELETAVRHQLALVVLVWRDNGYGVIRWKQSLQFHRTFGVDFTNPDMVRFAESFGAVGYRVSAPDELRPLLRKALDAQAPVVIDCPVDYSDGLGLVPA